jgi:hypothetical protein
VSDEALPAITMFCGLPSRRRSGTCRKPIAVLMLRNGRIQGVTVGGGKVADVEVNGVRFQVATCPDHGLIAVAEADVIAMFATWKPKPAKGIEARVRLPVLRRA